MKLKGLLPLASVIALALVAGCSSSASEPASEDTEGAISTQADESIKGAFSVVLAGHTVKFKFTMDEVDLRQKTVRWNAQITDRGGNAQAYDDVNERGRIVAVARCPGCYTAEIRGQSGNLARVDVNNFKVTSIVYEGVDAKLIQDAGATGGTTSADTGDSPDDLGACKLNGDNCKELARSECKAGSHYPAMRCCMSFTFEKGASCN